MIFKGFHLSENIYAVFVEINYLSELPICQLLSINLD